MKIHRVDLTRNFETTIYDAARLLLADGAARKDVVEIWRDGRLSMRGPIGKCARYKVRHNDHGNPALQLVRWEANRTIRGRARAAKTHVQVLKVSATNSRPSWATSSPESALEGADG